MEIMKITFKMDMLITAQGAMGLITPAQWASYASLDIEKKQMSAELFLLMQGDGDLT